MRSEGEKNLFARGSEVKRELALNQPLFVLLYKEALFNSNKVGESVPSVITSLL